MGTEESSEYVKARALLLAEYFGQRGWTVTAGKNNCILIYVPADKIFNYTADQLMTVISESDFHVKETGLKTSFVSYRFYYKGEFYKKLDVFSRGEYDLYDEE
ncbi:hypothetical protein [Pedobacter sp. R-06]|uniref:hypothetical protein n=1 Tax=Pedobacter sp. R-06 TaxID=3404051 RepID=UPI003CF0839E